MRHLKHAEKWALVLLLLAVALTQMGCAAGDERFTAEAPAGFLYGLWHGAIVVVAFVISLFSDTVGIYEVNNSGGWYNFGFVMGIVCISGGSFRARRSKRRRRHTDAEWEEIGHKVERKVMDRINAVVDQGTENPPNSGAAAAGQTGRKRDEEWEEIGRKVEEKIKRKLKKWAEEE